MITFKYTKKENDVSNRVFIPLVTPAAKNYFGIDITELSDEDQGIFMAEMSIIKEENNAKINALMKKFDIVHNFRAFSPEKMSDIVNEE